MIRVLTLIICAAGTLRIMACPVLPFMNSVTLHGAYAPVRGNALLGVEWDKKGPGLLLYRSIAFNYHLGDPQHLKTVQAGIGDLFLYPFTPVILSPSIGLAHYSEETGYRTHFTYGANLQLGYHDNTKWINGRFKLSYQRLAGAAPGISSRHLFTAGLGMTINAVKFTRHRHTAGRTMMGTGADF